MVVKFLTVARAVFPTVLGLAGIAAIVAGVGGWLGVNAALIAGGLPFAAFYIAGQVLQVRHDLPRPE